MHNSFKNTLNSMRTQVLSASYTQSVNLLIKANKMIHALNHYLFFQKYNQNKQYSMVNIFTCEWKGEML